MKSLLCSALLMVLGSEATATPGLHYLYLVRHGMYDRDAHALDDTRGNGLNALGHKQAKLLAARLAALPVKIDALVSSDFLRARETADELGPALKRSVSTDVLLRECTPGSVACEQNLTAVWNKYAVATPSADRYDVLVAHGNVIRWLTMRALGVTQNSWSSLDIANASLTVIAIAPDGSAHVVQFSDASHIPPAEQTWVGPGPGWQKRTAK